MNALVFVPKSNAHGKNDVTGAFLPEAVAFMRLHGIPQARRVTFDNTQDYRLRAKTVIDMLGRCERGTLEAVVFFCHGWRDGIQSGVQASFATFCDALALRCVLNPAIILYACSAGRDGDSDATDDSLPGVGDDGGFADRLRDELVKRGLSPRIVAHTCDGHTTRNPFVRIFDKSRTASGEWVVEPGSPQWQAWRKALKGPLRFTFPFLTPAGIAFALSQPGH